MAKINRMKLSPRKNWQGTVPALSALTMLLLQNAPAKAPDPAPDPVQDTVPAPAESYSVQGKSANKRQFEAARLQDEGLLLLRNNANQEALEKFKESISIYDGFPEVHHSMALAQAKCGNNEAAEKELLRALELNPDFNDSWLLLAGIYQLSGKTQKAISTYQELLKRNPKTPLQSKINTSLGLLYARLGKSQESINELKRSIELNPELASAWITLGGVYQANGQLEAAIETYEQFLNRFPQDPSKERIKNLSLALSKEKALQDRKLSEDREITDPVIKLSEAVKRNPGDAELRFQLANAYEVKGLFQEAVKHCDEFLLAFPADVRVSKAQSLRQNCLAKLQNREPDAKSSVKLAQASIETEPGSTKLPEPGGAKQPQTSYNKIGAGDDYLGKISWTRWPKTRIPVSVFIADGSACRGFRPALKSILKRSFQDWSRAANNTVSFTFVDSPQEARLHCLWTDKPATLKFSEAGEAKLWEDQSYISRAEISFLTINLNNKSSPISDNAFRNVALHEIGHALGLKDHSEQAGDIMFYSTGLQDSWRELSGRDARTIERLYKSDI